MCIRDRVVNERVADFSFYIEQSNVLTAIVKVFCEFGVLHDQWSGDQIAVTLESNMKVDKILGVRTGHSIISMFCNTKFWS